MLKVGENQSPAEYEKKLFDFRLKIASEAYFHGFVSQVHLFCLRRL